jgi:hypothetical protein
VVSLPELSVTELSVAVLSVTVLSLAPLSLGDTSLAVPLATAGALALATAAVLAAGELGCRPAATAAIGRPGTRRCGRANSKYKISATTMNSSIGNANVQLYPCGVLSGVTAARISPGTAASCHV